MAKKPSRFHAPNIPMSWSPPQDGWTKFNVDAALFQHEGKTGIGVVQRDQHGSFVSVFLDTKLAIFTPLLAELLAIKEALEWCVVRGMDRVCIESDCSNAVALLNGATRPDEAGSLAIDCTRIAQQIPQLIIQHISRKGNEAAHRLARDTYIP